VELQNPGSSSLTLKLFSIKNVANNTRGLQRFSLADSDCVLSQGETLADITDLENFKAAMRAAEVAQQLATPWNRSITALNSYLIASDYGAKDLAGRANRAQILTDFVNYIFTQNAENWRCGENFLSTTDVTSHWTQWFAASRVVPNAKKKKFWGNQQRANAASETQQSAFYNSHSRQRAPQFRPQGQQAQAARPAEKPRRRYNAGVCPNRPGECVTAAGTRLLHICTKDMNG
jgi:hypothetical protein